MAVIACPSCGKATSDKFKACNSCGASLAGPDRGMNNSPPWAGFGSVGLGLASVLSPYFAAVFFVPTSLICAAIAYWQGQKKLAYIGFLCGGIGLAFLINTQIALYQVSQELGNLSP